MPITFPAHQGFVAWTKLRWPADVDGTALCIGAATPDLAYPFGHWLASHSHSTLGVVIWGIPFALAITWAARTRSAAGIFAHLPDLGMLRVRSYRVIVAGRPPVLTTVGSAALGASSHVLIDSFTHYGRSGAQLLGLDYNVGPIGPVEWLPLTRLAQAGGHIVGSAMFLVVMVLIAKHGKLERWYGADLVRRARAVEPTPGSRMLFWTIVVGSVTASVVLALATSQSWVFVGITTLCLALLVAGAVVPEGSVAWARPIDPNAGPWRQATERSSHPDHASGDDPTRSQHVP